MRWRWLLVVTLVFGGDRAGRAQTPAGGTAASAARPADHVFVLMLDGTRPDVLRAVKTPTMSALAANGVRYLQARTIYPSQTRVAFVSLPTGSYTGSHGIVGGESFMDANWQQVGFGDDDPIKAQPSPRITASVR